MRKVETSRRNWFGDIQFRPSRLVRPSTAEEIRRVLRDREQYPSPVRAVGSSHSITGCLEADGGTLIDMSAMDKVLHVGQDAVTAQAGALYIDVAEELRAHGLQFHVNLEIGNVTVGSAACAHTKDSSFPGEHALISSYVIGMKLVSSDGELFQVNDEQPELLEALRTSYGLLGIVYEVTFRVRPVRPMAFHHENMTIDQFAGQCEELAARNEAIMYYLFPHHDSVTVEFRSYTDDGSPRSRGYWKPRNFAQRVFGPATARFVTGFVPGRKLRDALLNGNNRLFQALLHRVRSDSGDAADQIMRYPAEARASRYTFSIWVFPEADFPRLVREYFAFCGTYYKEHGFRCNLPNVGYRIARNDSALFSYSYEGAGWSLDPVSTGAPGWDGFLDAFNAFGSQNGGAPLFNQTPRLSGQQVERAFGQRLSVFRDFMRRYDPNQIFLNGYFARIIG